MKLTQAKVGLTLTQPFFASLALKMGYVEDKTIETACTDGRVIKYNPTWLESLPVDEIKTLIAHECMHVGLCHPLRRGARNPGRCNQAGDYVINGLLINAGFKLPQGGLHNSAYDGMNMEQVYDLIPEPPDDSPKWGEFEDGTGDPKEMEMESKQMMAEAAIAAKQAGKLPAEIERLIDDLLEPKLPWKEILARFCSNMARNDYNWKRPNARYIQQGIYLPVLENEEPGRIVFMADTSGSRDDEKIQSTASELASITTMMHVPVTVIYVDTKVVGEEELVDGQPIHPKGGGGTDYRPGFKHIEDKGIDCVAVVYFTDGECDSFPDEPDYPVLWILDYENKSFKPPFGEVAYI